MKEFRCIVATIYYMHFPIVHRKNNVFIYKDVLEVNPETKQAREKRIQMCPNLGISCIIVLNP